MVNPNNADDIEKGMLTLIQNKKLREELKEKRLIRAKEFSYEKNANEHIKVYEGLTNKNSTYNLGGR